GCGGWVFLLGAVVSVCGRWSDCGVADWVNASSLRGSKCPVVSLCGDGSVAFRGAGVWI
ncbi:hypothetical protein Dimus_006263, partial [Dionaea muscipula]